MNSCVLTIAVPTFNMDWCLNKNLATYCDPRLSGKVEVLCLNNASEDRSKDIILSFAEREPAIFRLVDRDSRGYGSSINDAIRLARGRYFRIVDADDWVDTEELIRLVEKLESCSCDVVLTDYTIVNMQDGACTPVCAGTYDVPYDEVLSSLCMPTKTLPSIHATTYRTELLRENGFQMQDGIFFVDEEYVILPYLHVKTVLYEPFNVYRYQVANPEQSTSPKNRGKYYGHREQVLKRLLKEYDSARKSGCSKESLNYCRERNRLKRKAFLVEFSDELEQCIPGPDDTPSRVEAKLLGESISRFLRKQPEEKRNVFLRRYWYLDSVGEIARRFSMSQSRVKTMLFRTRQELRTYLEQEGIRV